MAAPILVTGGTGTLGRLVVERLRSAGHDVRVLSRRARADADDVAYVTGDLATGEGVNAAVSGVEIIVHCAGSPKGDESKARTLVRAAARAGATHVINISVVGADRVPSASRFDRTVFSYHPMKLGTERVIAESGLPWTTLRATQFYDLILRVAKALAKLPVTPVPSGIQLQPVDTGEVADRLVELALGPPSGLVVGIAGPREYELADLVRSYLHAAGKRRVVLPVRLPGQAARAVRAGAVLGQDDIVGRRTWEEFLAEQVGTSSDGGADRNLD
jgi:uncharacterized protein YbjT (DUF2867 family)